MSELTSDNELKIHGRDRFGSISMVILALLIMPGMLIFYYYPDYKFSHLNISSDFFAIEMGLIVLITGTFIAFIYVAYFMYVQKTLRINENKIEYIVNEKVKKRILIKNIIGIELKGNYNQFYLKIFDGNTIIKFSKATYNAKPVDIKKAFKRILKYQPKYHFKVINKVGFD